MFYDFLNLISPLTCAACNLSLNRKEEIICNVCELAIHHTSKNGYLKKKLDEILNYRIPYQFSWALFEFENQSKSQNILHNIKYKGYQKTAYQLGIYLGEMLSNDDPNIDLITFVPLHKNKESLRGFNQSKVFAEGIGYALKKPVISTLEREKYTKTQTKMSKEQRWENVEKAFTFKTKKNLDDKHLLLVDDVITTGSTTVACYEMLSMNTSAKISLAYLAIAV
jgi:ComF family protein